MIAALDVAYDDVAGSARAAAVVFEIWTSEKAILEPVVEVQGVALYEPGAFYKRELPCLLAVLCRIEQPLEILIVDGYVRLGEGRPGLGEHLWDAMEGSVAVVGVGKTRFRSAPSVEMCRGGSIAPLYITSIGIPLAEAVEHIRSMHGPFRMPTLLTRVDQLSKCR
jgi:deoxyribonuclease V